MALNKFRRFDQNSLGITLPKDDLRVEGLLDEHGDLEGEHTATSVISGMVSGLSNSSRVSMRER